MLRWTLSIHRSLLPMPTRLAAGLGLRDAPLQKVTLKIRPYALKELGSPAFHLTRRYT